MPHQVAYAAPPPKKTVHRKWHVCLDCTKNTYDGFVGVQQQRLGLDENGTFLVEHNNACAKITLKVTVFTYVSLLFMVVSFLVASVMWQRQEDRESAET